MKITCYTHYFIPEIGAPSARFHDFSKEWLAMNQSVQVVTCVPNHPTGKIYPGYMAKPYMNEQIDGINVHRNWTYIAPNKGFLKKTLGHISFLPSAALIGNRYIDHPDIVIGSSPTFFAAMAAAWTGFRLNIPFIMEVRDLWPAIFVELDIIRNQFVIRWLEKLEMALYQQATRVVTVTEAFRRNLIDRGVPPEKVQTIPNGADVDYWKPVETPIRWRRSLGLENCFVVLYIGAHGISQALDSILETAAQLQKKPDIRFVFVGEGAKKKDLIKKAADLGLKNVMFHSSVDREGVQQFYSLADVCLVPLRDIPLFEGFIPSKMFEIMSMQRPIIASVRGEAAEILKESRAAVVVQPEDSAAIAKAVMELYHDQGLGKAMGVNGRAFVRKKYSRSSLAKSYLSVMQEAVKIHRYQK